jgi:hypothetical protein
MITINPDLAGKGELPMAKAIRSVNPPLGVSLAGDAGGAQSSKHVAPGGRA